METELIIKRLGIFGCVLVLHLLIGASLWEHQRRLNRFSPGELVTAPMAYLTYLPPPLTTEPARESSAGTRPQASPTTPASAAIAIASPPDAAEPHAPADWDDHAKRAAAKIAAESNYPEPRKRTAKPFAWDESSIERWEAAPTGGTIIRLSDRCQIVLAPLPLGGCSLGKIKARGDLFDEMKAPPEFGDWDRGSVPAIPR